MSNNKAWHGGKGSAPRKSANQLAYSDNWDKIFKKPENGLWQHNCKHNGIMSVGAGEECSWCGAKETD